MRKFIKYHISKFRKCRTYTRSHIKDPVMELFLKILQGQVKNMRELKSFLKLFLFSSELPQEFFQFSLVVSRRLQVRSQINYGMWEIFDQNSVAKWLSTFDLLENCFLFPVIFLLSCLIIILLLSYFILSYYYYYLRIHFTFSTKFKCC